MVMSPLMKATHKDHGLDEDAIRGLYEGHLMSDAEIGALYGLSDAGVGYLRRKCGISTMSAKERIARKAKNAGLRDIREVDKDEMLELYQRCGQKQLAKMFGCSKILIRSVLKDFNIGPISKEERQRGRYPDYLTDEQRQVLFGSLLGDGGLSINKNGDSCRFYESHGIDQLDYLRWKQRVLTPFSGRIRDDDKVLEDGRVARCKRFHTCFHPAFVSSWRMFYEDGEDNAKHLPEGFERELSPLALAVWYMDDGHLADKTVDGVFTIANGFGPDDIGRIVALLNGPEWCLDAVPDDQRDDITILWIYNKQRMFDLIGTHLHGSMTYKLPTSLRSGVIRGRLKPSKLLDKAAKVRWDGLDEDEMGEWTERLFRYWRTYGFSFPCSTKEFREVELAGLVDAEVPIEAGLIPTGHTQASSLCLTFFKNFWDAKRKGKRSPMEVFGNDKLLKKAIVDCIKHRDGISDAKMRAELQTFGGVHNFRPAVAKALIDRYCPEGGAVFDPCAGYGGRMMGFYASHAGSYVGVDASRRTVTGLRRMARTVGGHFSGKRVVIEHAAFEDLNMEGEFDLVFTSPPYFDAEWYGDDPEQSAVRYPDYAVWLEEFLFALVDKAVASLGPDGCLALNVANVKGGLVADDLRERLEGVIGVQEELRMVLSSRYGGRARYESVFVCKKSGVDV